MTPDADRDGLVRHLTWQANACRDLGAPFYAELLGHLADDAASGGVTERALRGHGADSLAVALALRLLGGVHRLVLEGRAPELGPSWAATGAGDAAATVGPLLDVVRDHPEEIAEALRRPPQTNEVGRGAALLGALHYLVALRPLPVRLVELGASAGLNLRADRFRVEDAEGRWFGPASSPVRLPAAWRGQTPPTGIPIEVVERVGCDPDPLDPVHPQDALTLRSYVWPEHTARVERLAGALELATAVPATVHAERAIDLLRRTELVPGTWLVVWHSVMWQYVDEAERAEVLDRLRMLGDQASDDAPLAHIALEPKRVGPDDIVFPITMQTWPDVGIGPDEITLGTSVAHGVPVQWANWPNETTGMSTEGRAHRV